MKEEEKKQCILFHSWKEGKCQKCGYFNIDEILTESEKQSVTTFISALIQFSGKVDLVGEIFVKFKQKKTILSHKEYITIIAVVKQAIGVAQRSGPEVKQKVSDIYDKLLFAIMEEVPNATENDVDTIFFEYLDKSSQFRLNNNFKECLKMCKKAEEFIDRISNPNDPGSRFFLYSNFALSYVNLHEEQSTKRYLEKAEAAIRANKDFEIRTASEYAPLARCWLGLGNLTKSQELFDRSIDLLEERNGEFFNEEMMNVCDAIATSCAKIGSPAMAFIYYSKALGIAQTIFPNKNNPTQIFSQIVQALEPMWAVGYTDPNKLYGMIKSIVEKAGIK